MGETDQANHQYDLSYFYETLKDGNMPSVSFLKAAAYEDGHAGYSDPLDEQRFLTDTINKIEQSPDWSNTAIVIAYDDSDGWYDHVMGPIVRHSESKSDALTGEGQCGSVPATPPAGFENDRCGFGPRLPLLVISPWAKQNFVDNSLTDQSSILSFIEGNWQLGRIGGGSTDAAAGSLGTMFDFNPNDARAEADSRRHDRAGRERWGRFRRWSGWSRWPGWSRRRPTGRRSGRLGRLWRRQGRPRRRSGRLR